MVYQNRPNYHAALQITLLQSPRSKPTFQYVRHQHSTGCQGNPMWDLILLTVIKFLLAEEVLDRFKRGNY